MHNFNPETIVLEIPKVSHLKIENLYAQIDMTYNRLTAINDYYIKKQTVALISMAKLMRDIIDPIFWKKDYPSSIKKTDGIASTPSNISKIINRIKIFIQENPNDPRKKKYIDQLVKVTMPQLNIALELFKLVEKIYKSTHTEVLQSERINTLLEGNSKETTLVLCGSPTLEKYIYYKLPHKTTIRDWKRANLPIDTKNLSRHLISSLNHLNNIHMGIHRVFLLGPIYGDTACQKALTWIEANVQGGMRSVKELMIYTANIPYLFSKAKDLITPMFQYIFKRCGIVTTEEIDYVYEHLLNDMSSATYEYKSPSTLNDFLTIYLNNI